MTASEQQLKQALQNSPMADAPEVRAAAAASTRVLRGRFRSRRLFLFLFSEHFEPVSLHGYHRRLKSPLVAVGPLEFERKSSYNVLKVIGTAAGIRILSKWRRLEGAVDRQPSCPSTFVSLSVPSRLGYCRDGVSTRLALRR